jgi:hypothetical protein
MMFESQCTRLASPMLPALLLLCFVATAAGGSFSNVKLSLTPPRGWNSYDSFSWIISEEEFLQNAEYVAANLLKYGYEVEPASLLLLRAIDSLYLKLKILRAYMTRLQIVS